MFTLFLGLVILFVVGSIIIYYRSNKSEKFRRNNMYKNL